MSTLGRKILSWVSQNKSRFDIQRAGPHVPSDARYMFELLRTVSEARTRPCRFLGRVINGIWSGQKGDNIMITSNVRKRQQNPYRTWGRVCFNSEEGNLLPAKLEGTNSSIRSNDDRMQWPCVCIQDNVSHSSQMNACNCYVADFENHENFFAGRFGCQ